MESARNTPRHKSNRRTGVAFGHGRAVLLILTICSQSVSLFGQQVANGITTVNLPFFGPAIFDAAGNSYSTGGGTVTAGAAQTQPGGGSCVLVGRFPIPGPCTDATIVKADASGNVIYGTLLGGPTADAATALSVDPAGNVYVAGTTGGSFPTTANAAIPTSTTSTVFAAKLSADGSRFLYSTYLPATAVTAPAIAFDAQGNAYIGGKTSTGHAYVAKLSADGSTFVYTVTLAGSVQDSAGALVVDAKGNVVVVGKTSSPDFPTTVGVVQAKLAGPQNAFLAKLDTNGNTIFSTYLGGSGVDAATLVQMDPTGTIYVAGVTASLDFPTTPGSFEPVPLVPLWNNASPGGFLARLAADGGAILYSSYVMTADSGLLQTGVASLLVTASGDAYISGLSGAGFPTTASAPQPCFGGPVDVFVAHVDPHGELTDATYLPNGNPTAGANFAQGLGLVSDGLLLVAWHSSGGVDELSRFTFANPGAAATSCLSPAVLNSATLNEGPVTQGEFVTLTGLGIGPDTGVAYQPDVQGRAPLSLAGVKVLFNGQPAPLLYVQSRQVNVQMPFELTGSTATISLQYGSAVFGPITVSLSLLATPGLFRLQPGYSTQAAAVNQDGTVNGPLNPARAGSVISLWGTGFAPISPACATGGLNPNAAVSLTQDFDASIDAAGLPAVITYAGGAPTLLCGIVQINMQVPAKWLPGVYLLEPWSQTITAITNTAQESFIGSTIYVK
jgi:uncharacterized protein (TIGR03437 family)